MGIVVGPCDNLWDKVLVKCISLCRMVPSYPMTYSSWISCTALVNHSCMPAKRNPCLVSLLLAPLNKSAVRRSEAVILHSQEKVLEDLLSFWRIEKCIYFPDLIKTVVEEDWFGEANKSNRRNKILDVSLYLR